MTTKVRILDHLYPVGEPIPGRKPSPHRIITRFEDWNGSRPGVGEVFYTRVNGVKEHRCWCSTWAGWVDLGAGAPA